MCPVLPVSLDCPFSIDLRHVSCVPNVASFSGLFFSIDLRFFLAFIKKIYLSKFDKTLDKKQLIKTVQYHRMTKRHI